MAIKTFSDGNSLPASDINTYLTNSGLVYVKSQTVGTGVSTVTVSNAFSADCDNYKIIYAGGVGNTPQAIQMRLGASVTGYYAGLMYVTYSTGLVTSSANNNAVLWTFIGESSNNMCCVEADIHSPFLAKFSTVFSSYRGTVAGTVSGYHGVAASYTDFSLIVAGNMTGGTITVYGYRKA
jgi:hypothetical protein